MTLGQKLKELRKKKGLSQREVGYPIEQDSAYISNVETGRKILSENHLAPLAEILETEEKSLRALWLGEKIYRVVENDNDLATQAFRVAEGLYEYHKNKKS